MTDLCTIGPLSLERSHLYDGNNFSYSSGTSRNTGYGASIFQKGQYEVEEEFSVICDSDEALQLKGIVEIGEPIWINTNSELTDNDYLQHKGWYILTDLDFEWLSDLLLQANITAYKISDVENEFLTMDYTKGFYDGVPFDVSYNITASETLLDDDMLSYTAANWDTVRDAFCTYEDTSSWNGTTGLNLVNDSGAGRGHGGCSWVRSQNKYYAPCTIEVTMDRGTLPSSGKMHASVAVGLCPQSMVEDTYAALYKEGGNDWMYIQWLKNTTATSLEIASNPINSGWRQEYPWTDQGVTDADMRVKIELQADGTATISKDLGVTGTYTEIYSGPIDIDISNGVYVYLYGFNNDTSTSTVYFRDVLITKEGEAVIPNVVVLPYGASEYGPQYSGLETRAGVGGNYPLFETPNLPIRFTTTVADLYDGSVMLSTTNNDDDASRYVYSTETKLTNVTTVLENAFTKLVFNANGFVLYGYDSSAWQEINTFTFGGGLDYIKPVSITPDRVVLQLNMNKVTMLRSSPLVTLKLNEPLYHIRHDRCYHDETLTTVTSDGQELSMYDPDVGYYAYSYNNATPTYRTIYGYKDLGSKFGNYVPSGQYVGIGWNKSTHTSLNSASSLVQQWWKQTKTGISFKQVV